MVCSSPLYLDWIRNFFNLCLYLESAGGKLVRSADIRRLFFNNKKNAWWIKSKGSFPEVNTINWEKPSWGLSYCRWLADDRAAWPRLDNNNNWSFANRLSRKISIGAENRFHAIGIESFELDQNKSKKTSAQKKF